MLSPLAAQATTITTTYDYKGISNPSSTSNAFFDASSTFTTTTAPTLLGDVELTTAHYRNIDTNDAANTGTLVKATTLRHFRFHFLLTETPAAIGVLHPF